MTDDISKDQILEIYKLHAELADRVSQRLEGVNRLCLSLLSGLMILFAALLRLVLVGEVARGDLPSPILFATTGLISCLGAMISLFWYRYANSCIRIKSAKLAALRELELKLDHQFCRRELELLHQDDGYDDDYGLNLSRRSLWVFERLLFSSVGLTLVSIAQYLLG